MPTRPIPAKESMEEFRFPLAGIDLSQGYDRQPVRPMQDGSYARTTPTAINVRAYEPTSGRARGGQRPGLSPYIQGQLNGSASIQDLDVVVTTAGTVPGSTATVQALVFFDQRGNVVLSNGGGTVWAYPWGTRPSTSLAGIGNASGGPTVCVIDGQTSSAITTSWQYVLLQGGAVLSGPTTLPIPAGGSKIRDAAVETSGSNFYVAGLAQTSPPGPTVFYWLCLQGVGPTGAALWTSILPLPSTVASGDTAVPFTILAGTLYLWVDGVGVLQVSAATGSFLSPSILASVGSVVPGGYHVLANNGVRPALAGGSMAASATRLAFPLQTSAGLAAYGLALVNTATGAVTQKTGLAPQATNAILDVISDGTDFYTLSSTATGDVGTAVVQKLDGLTGAVLWTSATFSGNGTLAYLTASGTIAVSGKNASLSLSASTGAAVGGGPGSNLYIVKDAGSYAGGGTPAIGTGASASLSSQVQVLVGVAGGTVKVAYGGTWQPVVNGPSALNGTVAVVRSAACNGKLYFADTTNWKLYNPTVNTVQTWAASAGSLPVDSLGNLPRLIVNWRGRLVLAGLPNDAYNWFMSAQSDPTNWDYFPALITPTQAVAGENAPQGLMEDVITCLIPYTDDVLIMGGNHTIWQMAGDPMIGGTLERVSDIIGIAYGLPWCRDPQNNLYFFSNRCGIYRLQPGQDPVRISQAIEQLLFSVPLDSVVIRMGWDDQSQGLHVFVTPWGGSGPATHYYWEARTGGWFQESFTDPLMNPLCCLSYYGSNPTDRVLLIGSWNGYVRSFQPTATTDDGTAIASQVLIGPFLTKDLDEVMLKDVQGILSAFSGQVQYAVYVGPTAEIATALPAVASGTWSAGRNLTSYIRRAGHAVYVGISASNSWAIETIRLRVTSLGKVRRRGY